MMKMLSRIVTLLRRMIGRPVPPGRIVEFGGSCTVKLPRPDSEA